MTTLRDTECRQSNGSNITIVRQHPGQIKIIIHNNKMNAKIQPSDIISHIRTNEEDKTLYYQSNYNHCIGVANLAKHFAESFGMGGWGYTLGLLHDKGKENRQFQAYIRDINGIPRQSDYTPMGKAHAYVGAVIAKNIYGRQALQLFCNQIASHHRGLYDYCELEEIIKKPIPVEIKVETNRYPLEAPLFKMNSNDFHHLSRMLYSCLVDADYLDTEAFLREDDATERGCYSSMDSLKSLLEKYLKQLELKAIKSDINKIRKNIQSYCKDMSNLPKGFYSLTVPTGGGKTLSSLLWAIRHATFHGMKRIIIAIPYTSIIVQTANVLKQIFGEENVLEHHSDFDPSSIKNTHLRHKAKLATENWDYPIIVTTNVQLFESMFSNKPSICRKLHNIANSIIILDEVQTLPTDFLQPIVDSLKSYQKMFGISVLLTTASQPILSGIIEGCNPNTVFSGIDNITEIAPQNYDLHNKLRRVQLEFDETISSYDDIASRLSEHKRVLCIVNTRNDAREIFSRLPKEGSVIHLSRMMCPRHISQSIKNLKKKLAEDNDKIIRVVSTQLIEAGVDIDFPVVYRQEAGLDSILQAAGRCNREGKQLLATTHIFSLASEHNLHGSIKDANQARINMTNVKDWFSPQAMNEYFKQLYCRKETFDKKKIKDLLYKSTEMCFEKASKEFHLIEDNGKSVIVNFDFSNKLFYQFKNHGITYSLIKELAQFSVTIHDRDFHKLLEYGAIEEIIEGTGLFIINDKAQYDDNIGLRLDNHWMNELLMV